MPRIHPDLKRRREVSDRAVGARLATLRRERGISQADLAGLLGVPQSWVGKIELGQRRLSFVEAVELAAALGMPIADLEASAPPAAQSGPDMPPRSHAAGRGKRVREARACDRDETDFSEAGLARAGFVGFETSAGLIRSGVEGVPTGPGVYLVLRTGGRAVRFLPANPAGRFKGRDPSVARAVLQERWIADSAVLYIGKADALRRRVRQFLAFGAGAPVAHWGGRLVWQVAGSGDLLVAWRESPQPLAEERALLSAFLRCYGALPFANHRR